MADDFRRIFASDSGTGNDGGAPPLRIQPSTGGDFGSGTEGPGIRFSPSVAKATGTLNLTTPIQRTATFTADAIIVAAPKSRDEALIDLAAFGGGGYVGHVLWQMMGQRGWLGEAVGAVLGVYWIRRRFPR